MEFCKKRTRQWKCESLGEVRSWGARTGYGALEFVKALAGEEDVCVAMGELVRSFYAGKVLEHSLLHRELERSAGEPGHYPLSERR